ncbi:hypothetical protein C8J57DRAFT_1249161 [Mycena rebaudengoi]|nr:hypothetical protein C8J57DRAFT_1249161 [Mycena rebaudengoi]
MGVFFFKKKKKNPNLRLNAVRHPRPGRVQCARRPLLPADPRPTAASRSEAQQPAHATPAPQTRARGHEDGCALPSVYAPNHPTTMRVARTTTPEARTARAHGITPTPPNAFARPSPSRARHPASTRTAWIQHGSTPPPGARKVGIAPRLYNTKERKDQEGKGDLSALREENNRKERKEEKGGGRTKNEERRKENARSKTNSGKKTKMCAYASVVRDVHRGGGGEREKGREERVGRRRRGGVQGVGGGRRGSVLVCKGGRREGRVRRIRGGGGGGRQYRVRGRRGEEDERVCFARGRARDGQQRHIVQPGRVNEELALGL